MFKEETFIQLLQDNKDLLKVVVGEEVRSGNLYLSEWLIAHKKYIDWDPQEEYPNLKDSNNHVPENAVCAEGYPIPIDSSNQVTENAFCAVEYPNPIDSSNQVTASAVYTGEISQADGQTTLGEVRLQTFKSHIRYVTNFDNKIEEYVFMFFNTML